MVKHSLAHHRKEAVQHGLILDSLRPEEPRMEPVISTIVLFSSLLVPALALAAIVTLHMQPAENDSGWCQLLYFGTLLVIAFVTLRTMATNDGCWLIHTATLGITIVAGAMRRPSDVAPRFAPDFHQ